MTQTRISATNARTQFADLINRVQFHGEEIIIERQKEPVAKITPIVQKRTIKLKPLPVYNLGRTNDTYRREDLYDKPYTD